MIKLKDILNEDEKSPSENPDKILVKNKKSGFSYYIDKDNFDSSLHEKPKGNETEKKPEDSKTPSPAGDKKDDKTAKPDAGGTDKDKEEKKPNQPIKTKVHISDYELQNLTRRSKGIRPDLEDKLINYNYNKLFDEYNNTQMQGADAGKLTDVIKKFQTVAIAKYSLLSNEENDPKTIEAAQIYRANARQINRILQKNEKILPKDKLEKQIEKKGQPEELTYEFKKSMAIYDMDEHFKTPGSKLDRDIVVYKGVDKSIINKFATAGRWVDNGFVSTSLNPIVTDTPDSKERNPLLKIHLKIGDSVLILSKDEDKNFFETEVTLPRGCTFTIGNYDEVKNSYDVDVEYPNA